MAETSPDLVFRLAMFSRFSGEMKFCKLNLSKLEVSCNHAAVGCKIHTHFSIAFPFPLLLFEYSFLITKLYRVGGWRGNQHFGFSSSEYIIRNVISGGS